MRGVPRWAESVVRTIDAGHGDPCEFFLWDIGQATYVDAVHFSYRRLRPEAERRTPQCLQKKWTFLRVLNLYSVRSASPATRRKRSGVATAGQNRVLRQMEQLQR